MLISVFSKTVVLNVLLSYLRIDAGFLKVLGNSGVVSLVFFYWCDRWPVSHVAAGSPPVVVAGGSAHPPAAWPPLPADTAFLLVAKQSRDPHFQPLKVPKCESFDLLDFHDFCTIKPLWADDFCTVRKIFKIFSFWLWFRSLFGQNYELQLTTSWPCANKFSLAIWLWKFTHQTVHYMKRLYQGYLHPKLKSPGQTCPGRESNPGVRVVCEHSIKEQPHRLLTPIRNLYIWVRNN